MTPSTPTPQMALNGATAGLVGLVLAAGAGRRMGGPKALVGPLAGPGKPTPLEQVCRWVQAAGCNQVIAVIGAGAEQVQAALPQLDWLTVVVARDWPKGMGASLQAGLAAAAQTNAQAALITLVDLPDVQTPVYARLAQCPITPNSLARACFGGVPGHPVLIGKDWWPQACQLAVGDQGARQLFASTAHQLVECGDLASGSDVDTPTP